MKTKQELYIEYQGLICSNCKHPIIWQAADKEGMTRGQLEHIDLEQYDTTKIIKISKDCWCGCQKARD